MRARIPFSDFHKQSQTQREKEYWNSERNKTILLFGWLKVKGVMLDIICILNVENFRIKCRILHILRRIFMFSGRLFDYQLKCHA